MGPFTLHGQHVISEGEEKTRSKDSIAGCGVLYERADQGRHLTISQYLSFARLLIVVALFPAGFIVGCQDERERFDHWKDLQAVMGEAQEKRTKDRIAADKELKRKTDETWKARITRLNLEHESFSAELLASADIGVVPTPAPTTSVSGGAEERSGVVCFAGARLSEGISGELAQFAERYSRSIQEGAIAIAGFQACSAWALEVNQASPQ